METLLNQLNLTGISSSNEFDNLKKLKMEQKKIVINNGKICIEEDFEVEVLDQNDEDDYEIRKILAGECS